MIRRTSATLGLLCALALSAGCIEDHDARIYDQQGECWRPGLTVNSWTSTDEECEEGEALATDKWGACFIFTDGCVPGRYERVTDPDEVCARRLAEAPICS